MESRRMSSWGKQVMLHVAVLSICLWSTSEDVYANTQLPQNATQDECHFIRRNLKLKKSNLLTQQTKWSGATLLRPVCDPDQRMRDSAVTLKFFCSAWRSGLSWGCGAKLQPAALRYMRHMGLLNQNWSNGSLRRKRHTSIFAHVGVQNTEEPRTSCRFVHTLHKGGA